MCFLAAISAQASKQDAHLVVLLLTTLPLSIHMQDCRYQVALRVPTMAASMRTCSVSITLSL